MAKINIVVSNLTGKPVYCQRIRFKLDIGNGGTEVTGNVTGIELKVSNGDKWSFTSDGQGNFTAKPKRRQDQLFLDDGLLFSIQNLQVNHSVGVFALYIEEVSSEDGEQFEPFFTQKYLEKVNSRPAIRHFKADPEILYAGHKTTLTWEGPSHVEYEIRCGSHVHKVDSTHPEHRFLVSDLDTTTTFYLSAVLHDKKVVKEKTVTVLQPEFADFHADKNLVNYGESVTLSWALQGPLEQVELMRDGVMVCKPDRDTTSFTFKPEQSKSVYWLRGVCGSKTFESKQVAVAVQPMKFLSFTANPSTFEGKQKVLLHWEAESAICKIDPMIGEVSPSGEREVEVAETTTFAFQYQGADGQSGRQELVVTVLVPVADLIAGHQFFIPNVNQEKVSFAPDGRARIDFTFAGTPGVAEGTWSVEGLIVKFVGKMRIGDIKYDGDFHQNFKYDRQTDTLLAEGPRF